MKRVLLTGATGYLGSRLVKALLAKGYSVTALKRENSSLRNLDDVKGEIQLCNIADVKVVLADNTKVDCFINAACKYPRNVESEEAMFEANYLAPLSVFLDCLHYGVKKYFTIGTGLDADFNAYSFSKQKLAETYRWYVQRQHDMGAPIQVCNIQLENYYGENEPKGRFIPGVIDKLKHDEIILLTAGDQKRDFIYIGDVIQAIISLIERPDLPEYLDLPLGTGEGPAVREVVEYLKEITGSKSELCFGAIEKRMHEPDSVADCTKMREYGIKVKYSWRDGMKKIV